MEPPMSLPCAIGTMPLATADDAPPLDPPGVRAASHGLSVRPCSSLSLIQRTPWGRVLRAVREDEDAARALGKNAFAYKLQSLAIAAAIGALAGTFLAFYLASLHPDDFQPLVTFYAYGVLVLGGLASYWGVLAGSVILWVLLEGTRYIDLPISDTQEASLRFFIVGVVLILVMIFRPQGAFGNKQEMFLGD